MDDKKLEQFHDRVTYITGASKNAGKTTFLNYLLPRLRPRGPLGFLTIGVDGERKDRVFGNEKPAIKTMEGDYILTAESMLNKSDALFEIYHVFPWKTALGSLVLLRTVRSGFIELAGPENHFQLRNILSFLRNEVGVGTILVDGAVNRITQISVGENVSFYYVMTINPENRSRSLQTIRTLSLLDSVQIFHKEKSAKEKDLLKVEGALTSSYLKKIGIEIQTVVVDDFTKVFLTYRELKGLMERASLFFLRKLSIESFVLNLCNIEKKVFLEELNLVPLTIPFLFNPYREEKSLDD